MMPALLRAALLAALVAAPAAAQTGFALSPADPAARTLTVTGEGSAEARADEALLRFVVRTKDDTPD